MPPGYVKVNPPAHFKQNEETLPPDLSDAVVSSNYYLPPTNESVGISTTEIPTDVPEKRFGVFQRGRYEIFWQVSSFQTRVLE